MNEQVAKMQLDALRRNQAEAMATQAAEVAKEQLKAGAKKLATRTILRLVGGTMAVTLVGMVVTYAIWTIQFFAGNLFRSKIIPKLELWEIACWVGATLAGISLIIMLGVMLQLIFDPWSAGKFTLATIVDFWNNLFNK